MTLDSVGELKVRCSRNVKLEAGSPVTMKAPVATLEIPQVTLKGNLQVDGNIAATGTILDVGGNSNRHSH